MSEIAADRNLLFGILALQMDFVTRDALIAAMNAWVLDKQQPLGAMLVAQGVLRPERRALLEPLVDEHIRQHSDDPAQSLAAVGAGTSTREALRSIADGDLRFSLGHLGTASSDPESTATYVGSPTSSGGRFRILRFEAAGGLGEVYVARDEELQREVALKQIKNEHSHNQDLRSRFVVEAEITGGLEHPGIVPVYGLGHYDDGRPYYAMRFIKGESLKEAIKRFHQAEQPSRDPAARSLGLRQLLRRFLDVCNAIQYAHDRGVLHRDLKPGNVMLGPYGETLVVDWGLAKVVGRSDPTLPEETLQPASGSDVAATEAGVAIGTLVYMSPEQARGDLDRLGPASDVYSLGATLYHLLTGKAPFRGTDRAVLQAQVIAGEFPPPRQVHPAVPAGMDAICRKAMAREPKDRYARPRALADDIEHWVADEPVTALPESWSQRAARWTRRHRAWAQAGAAALVLVTFVSIAATFAVNRARGQAEQRRKDADEQRKDADEQRYRAELQLARSDLDRGLNFCEQGDAARGLLWLARGLNDAPADAADLRHCMRMNLESWSRECHTPLICLEHGIGCTAVAFSPDGKTILTGSGDRAARLWDVATGKPIGSSLTHQSPVFAVAFSPDGKTIATGGGFEVRLWDAATGKSFGTPLTHPGAVRAVAFSPDGKTIAAGSEDKTARLWDAATGKPMGTPMTHQNIVNAVAYSPDGKTIVTGSWDKTARLWDAATGKPMGTPMTHQNIVSAVAFSPDGKTIATGGGFEVRLWDANTGTSIGPPLTHQGFVSSVAFSPDGKTIATGSYDNTARLWDAATGKPMGTPMTHQGFVDSVAFSPDGKTIATESLMRARLWNVTAGKYFGTALTYRGDVTAVAFSPDGKTIATESNDHTFRLWDAATGKPIGSPMTHQGEVTGVAFSPDSKTIATRSLEGTARLWDAATGKPLGSPMTNQGGVTAMDFSPDGKTIVTGSWDKTARLWDVATGKPLGSPMTNQGGVTAVAFSSDGKTIATASLDRTARLWDAATGKPMGTPVTCQVWAFARAFSPDGKTIATVIGNTARLWDARTGKPLASPMAHQGMVLDVAFSPDGRTIATGSQDSVRLWDAATGKPIGPPLTHQDIVHAVAFSPDGKTIATGSRDRTARLWNVPSPMEGDADRITVWLRFLTNMELDSSDAINALDVHAWDQSRQELARRGGPPRQVNHGPEPDVAWHRREATESEASGQWFTARWHLDRLIAANPQDGSLYARRCSALAQLGLLAQAEKDYARAIDHGADAQDPQIQTFLAEICIRLGHLAEAADDYARLIELEPEPSSNWVKATYAQLLAGRVDRYRELSRAMLQRFEESPLGADAERTAKACLTVPDRPDLVARAAALAMRSLRHKPNDAGTVYCAALADYHVGRYELALYRLRLGRAALKSTPFGDWPGHPVMSYAVEAMASARLGHGAEARAALKQAETTLTTGLAAVRGTEGYLDFWHDWVHCEFLVREAQAVVADLGFPADPFAH